MLRSSHKKPGALYDRLSATLPSCSTPFEFLFYHESQAFSTDTQSQQPAPEQHEMGENQEKILMIVDPVTGTPPSLLHIELTGDPWDVHHLIFSLVESEQTTCRGLDTFLESSSRHSLHDQHYLIPSSVRSCSTTPSERATALWSTSFPGRRRCTQ